MLSGKLKVQANTIKTNARIKYLPDDSGKYCPKSITVFDRPVFMPPGWEEDKKHIKSLLTTEEDAGTPSDDEENRRKSFSRAKNNLFDLLLCTPSLDSFITLTFNAELIARDDYSAIIKRLSVWLDNRVRRKCLKYVLVPEFHKDGSSVHFHGLVNFDALSLVRAVNNDKTSRYYLEPLFDNKGREIYNIKDFPFGHTTVIKITGENGREACAKYCYKYIIKSNGQKVGGRYYLSGGDLGRPRYEYTNIDYETISQKEIDIKGFMKMKRYNL